MMKPPDMNKIPSAEFILSIANEMKSASSEEIAEWACAMANGFHTSAALDDALPFFFNQAKSKVASGVCDQRQASVDMAKSALSCAFQLGFMVSERMNDPQSPGTTAPGDTPPEPFILTNKLGRD